MTDHWNENWQCHAVYHKSPVECPGILQGKADAQPSGLQRGKYSTRGQDMTRKEPEACQLLLFRALVSSLAWVSVQKKNTYYL
jgi:hypothetical protein